MFKTSTTNKQLGLFTTASSFLMCKRESKQYEDEKEWHMQFYRNVTCNIDEDVFRPLFDEKMGCPTKAIPWDERKKRNNVEASICQYCFHTRNNKTRYRGLIKHTLQAIARCAWINMRRLFLYDIEMSLQIA